MQFLAIPIGGLLSSVLCLLLLLDDSSLIPVVYVIKLFFGNLVLLDCNMFIK